MQTWIEDIIYLNFNIVNDGIVETLMLIKNFSHFITNHFFMLFHHLGIFKVFSNQFLSELKEKDILLSLFKSAAFSEAGVAIGEFPEFFGEIEPAFKGVGGDVVIAT